MVSRKIIPVVSIVALVSVFAALNLSLSMRSGTLSTIPVYDDVVYLLDGAKRVLFDHPSSIFDILKSFQNNPPHSPLSALTAMLGYMLFGLNVWAPYLAGIWALFAYVTSIYLILRQKMAGVTQALMITGMLMFPRIVEASMTEFRPDISAAILYAMALYSIIHTNFAEAKLKNCVGVGIIVAAAVMAKPSAVIMVVPMLIIGFAMSLACLRSEYRSGLLGMAKTVGVAAIFLVPFTLVWARHIYEYLFQVFVTNRDIWRTEGDWLFHWTYHSVGMGGFGSLGIFVYISFGMILLDLIINSRNKDPRILSFYAILAIQYAGMSISSEKTAYQGAFFYIPLLFACAAASGRIVSRLSWSIFPLSFAFMLAIIFLPPANVFRSVYSYPRASILVEDISDFIAEAADRCKAANIEIASLTPNPVTAEAVALRLAFDWRINATPSQFYFARTPEDVIESSATADFILFPNAWGIRESTHLPGTAFVDDLSAALAESGEWRTFPAGSEDPMRVWARSCPGAQ